MINRDQNTHSQRTQRGWASHLCGLSHQRLLLSTPTHQTQESGFACVDLCLCVCICVCGRPLTLMASFHCGHPVSSDHVTVVSSRLSAPPADTCATQTCGQRHKAREGALIYMVISPLYIVFPCMHCIRFCGQEF